VTYESGALLEKIIDFEVTDNLIGFSRESLTLERTVVDLPRIRREADSDTLEFIL
jgi:hypothetical protein